MASGSFAAVCMDKEFKAAFDGLNKRLDGIDSRLDSMDQRFDAVDSRLDAMDRRFDAIDSRLDGVDKRLGGIDNRLDAVDRRFDTVDGRFDQVDQRFDAVDSRFDGVDGRLDQHSKMLADLIEIVTDQKRMDVDMAETLSVLDAKLDGTATSVALAQLRAEHGGFQRALNQDLAKLGRRTDDLEARMAVLRS